LGVFRHFLSFCPLFGLCFLSRYQVKGNKFPEFLQKRPDSPVEPSDFIENSLLQGNKFSKKAGKRPTAPPGPASAAFPPCLALLPRYSRAARANNSKETAPPGITWDTGKDAVF